jgi:adenylate cyclase
VRVLGIVMATLFAATIVLTMLPPERVPFFDLSLGAVPFGKIAAFYGMALLYELVAHSVLGYAIAHRRRLPEPPRYGNAFIETSIPTMMMILLSGAIGPEVALNSPLPMAYFIFICLSTLRLSAPLSIFTGCVAASSTRPWPSTTSGPRRARRGT